MISHIFEIPIPIAEKIVRAILVYISLILLLRVFGKRELARLNPFDFIVLLTLSNTVQNAIIGEDNSFTGGLIGAVALLSANYVVVRIMFRYPRLDEMLGGKPAALIEDGKPDAGALKRELVTERELWLAANRQGIDDLADVRRGELEPNGAFSFEKYERAELSNKLDVLNERVEQLLQRKH